MKEYKVNNKITITGEDLKSAIEAGFDQIATELHLGNAAGYQLDEVWFDWDDATNAVVLHVTAHGSDMLVDYDPANDPPKTQTITIQATKEDCPNRVNIDLADDRPTFDPFAPEWDNLPSAAMGILVAMIDEVGTRHCVLHETKDDKVSTLVTSKFPIMRTTAPLQYAEQCRARLARLRPKTDAATAQLMVRISELAVRLQEFGPKADYTADIIFCGKTSNYFRTHNKVTALAAIRMKKGMTQKALAEAAKMSLRQLQNYERCPGSTLFSASRSVPDRLAKSLGVPKSAIVDTDGSAVLQDA